MRELALEEVQATSGGRGLTAIEGAGFILGLTAMALGSPIVLGIGFGAATGLLIAHVMAY